ncbi:MAG: ATP-binding protein [Anaerolineae bacterium]|jgi:MinD superfamily P-loop ATPase
MKQLVILSGKGGTGKTTVAAALAHLAARDLAIVMADADVDAANLELVLEPTRVEEHDFRSGKRAVIEPQKCTACGVCETACRFDAIRSPTESVSSRVYRVDALSCEGCASCFYQCPEGAIRMEEQIAGRWFRSDSRFGPLFHAHLFAGHENSGKLVTLVKQQGRLLASDTGARLLLVDGPPGIGCPVISASAGADLALLVVEPTVSGVHDLERILGTTEHFGVPALVVINKADLSSSRSDQVAQFCAQRAIEVLGRIPYNTVVTEAMVDGRPVTAYTDGAVSQALHHVWRRVKMHLELGIQP